MKRKYLRYWRCDEIGLELYFAPWLVLLIGRWLDFKTFSYRTGWTLMVAGRVFDHSSFIEFAKPL